MEQIAPESEAAGLSSAVDSLRGRYLEHPERLGDYRVLREIGRGGMGVVYEAEQVSLGRHVALKVLPRLMLPDRGQRERFDREARAAARLHHTNIVPVFGVGEDGGLHYYVMQYIQGQGLDTILDELRRMWQHEGLPRPIKPANTGAISHPGVSVEAVVRSLLTRFDPSASGEEPTQEPTEGAEIASVGARGLGENDSAARAAASATSIAALGRDGDSRKPGIQAYWRSVARIAVQVADALAYAHQAGVLHRDIKPANLLLDTRGNVWVTDFGLAKSEDQQNLTNPGDVVGTLRYMAPERLEGHSDARGDLYALGATLYELLTLKPPFEDTRRERLIERVLHQDPIPPRKRDARIPARPGSDLPEVPEQGAGPPLRRCGGAGRGIAAVPGGQADSCAACLRDRAGVAVVPPQQGDCEPLGIGSARAGSGLRRRNLDVAEGREQFLGS